MEVSDALREEGQFFDNVLNYIAPQFYFHEDQQQEITTKFMKNVTNADKPQQMGIDKSERKDRFDIDKEKSMAEIQRERINEANEASKQRKKDMERMNPQAIPKFDSKPAATIDELSERLHAKRDALVSNRMKKTTEGNKNRASNNNKQMKREQPKEESKEEPKEESVPTNKKPVTITPNISEVLSNVQFGKFMEQEKNNLKFQVHKSKKQKLTKLLEKTQEMNKRLEELKNTEEGQKMAEDLKWNNVIKKANGVKVKDDEARISKSLKKMEEKKKKSEQTWKARIHKQKQEKKLQEKNKRAGFEGRKQGFLNKQKNNKPAPNPKK